MSTAKYSPEWAGATCRSVVVNDGSPAFLSTAFTAPFWELARISSPRYMLQLAAERIFARPAPHAVLCVCYGYETYKNANGLNSFSLQSTESQAVPAGSQEVRSFVKPDVAGGKPGHSMFTGSWERALSRLLLSINSK